MISKKEFAKLQDHSILEPFATRDEVKAMCEETIKYGFGATYVNPNYVSYAKEILGNKANVGTVIGFPHGANTTKIKILEVVDAIENGADKVDLVMNYSRLKSGESEYVQEEIREVVKAAKSANEDVIVKVIIETCYLTHDEKVLACEIVSNSGADYIKTSTGTGSAGCRIGDIRLMRKVCKGKVKIKAAAQITNIEDALAVIEEGATAIGENTAVKLLEDWDKQLWND